MDERARLTVTDQMAGQAGRTSLTGRIFGAWRDLRASMRAFMALGPSESTLFAVFLASGLFACLGQLAEIWISPATAEMDRGDLLSRAAGVMAAALIFRTLALYLLAAVSHLVCRAAGGTGSTHETRAATAWAAIVAAPVDLALSVGGALVERSSGQSLPVEGAAFAVALAFCLADRHGFRNAWVVLAVLIAIPLTIVLGLALAFGSFGPIKIAA